MLLEQQEVFYGLFGLPFACIKSYLGYRSQYIKIQAARSDMYNISAEVPQGSCLRYLLFCAYTSTLANVILETESFYQYADDTQLVCGISTGNSI